MFTPKKTKYKKFRKIKPSSSHCKRGCNLAFGEFGIKAVGTARLDGRQLESARRVITRVLAKTGKLWIRCFPTLPLTKKPADVRMGGGKGSVEKYVFPISPGRIILELDGVSKSVAKTALLKAAAKLPCSVNFVSRSNVSL